MNEERRIMKGWAHALIIRICRTTNRPIPKDVTPGMTAGLEAALDALSGKRRDAMLSVYKYGMTAAEYAEKDGCTKTAAYLRLHQATLQFYDPDMYGAIMNGPEWAAAHLKKKPEKAPKPEKPEKPKWPANLVMAICRKTGRAMPEAITEDMAKGLDIAVHALTKKQQALVLGIYKHNRTTTSLAKEFGTTPSSVNKAANRGIDRFREQAMFDSILNGPEWAETALAKPLSYEGRKAWPENFIERVCKTTGRKAAIDITPDMTKGVEIALDTIGGARRDAVIAIYRDRLKREAFAKSRGVKTARIDSWLFRCAMMFQTDMAFGCLVNGEKYAAANAPKCFRNHAYPTNDCTWPENLLRDICVATGHDAACIPENPSDEGLLFVLKNDATELIRDTLLGAYRDSGLTGHGTGTLLPASTFNKRVKYALNRFRAKARFACAIHGPAYLAEHKLALPKQDKHARGVAKGLDWPMNLVERVRHITDCPVELTSPENTLSGLMFVMDHLSKTERTVLLSYFRDGVPAKDLMELTNSSSEKSVQARISRALRGFRRPFMLDAIRDGALKAAEDEKARETEKAAAKQKSEEEADAQAWRKIKDRNKVSPNEGPWPVNLLWTLLRHTAATDELPDAFTEEQAACAEYALNHLSMPVLEYCRDFFREKHTYTQVARKCNCSRENVRQAVQRGIKLMSNIPGIRERILSGKAPPPCVPPTTVIHVRKSKLSDCITNRLKMAGIAAEEDIAKLAPEDIDRIDTLTPLQKDKVRLHLGHETKFI